MIRHKNRTELIGELYSDPKLNFTNTGTAVCNGFLKTVDYVNKDGEEFASFHRIVAWKDAATYLGKLAQGDTILVEGKTSTRSYEKDGEKRYITEVTASVIALLAEPDLDEGTAQEPEPKKETVPSFDEDIDYGF